MELLKAVCALGDLDGRLTAEHLDQLKPLLPTPAEAKRYAAIAGGLQPHLAAAEKAQESSDASKKVQQEEEHPAEAFHRAALLLYPELPVRLEIFSLALNLPEQMQQASDRVTAVTQSVNQLLSAPRLAAMLQRLLLLGKAAAQAGATNSHKAKAAAAAAAGSTVLEQLLAVAKQSPGGSSKPSNAGSSLLELLVQSLYEQREDHLLGAVEELRAALGDAPPLSMAPAQQAGAEAAVATAANGGAAASSPSMDADRAVESLLQAQQRLRQEIARLGQGQQASSKKDNKGRAASAAEAAALPFASPTARQLSDQYTVQLQRHAEAVAVQLMALQKRRLLMRQKVRALLEYFGEEAPQGVQPVAADCGPLFNALRELRFQLAAARETVEWRLYRSSGAV